MTGAPRAEAQPRVPSAAPPPHAGATKVLVLDRLSSLGGGGRVILTELDLLATRGFTPVLGVPGEGELAEQARARGFTVVPLELERMRATLDPLQLLRYSRALRRDKRTVLAACREHAIDLIHAHHPVAAMYALRAVRELGIPMVMHIHEGPPMKLHWAAAVLRTAPRARRLICVSHAGRELLLRLRVPSGKIQVLYNSVHGTFAGGPPAPAPDVTGSGPHIGVFGSIEPRKGQNVFLDAAGLLSRRIPAAHFWVVGPVTFSDNEPFHTSLQRRAAEPDLSGRVTFTGFRRDIPNLMQSMDAVAVTSLELESAPLVCMEAMALGKPLVASRVAGVPELVRDGETGFLVAPGNAAALAEMLARAVTAEGATVARRAAENARARFHPDRFGDELAASFREVLA